MSTYPFPTEAEAAEAWEATMAVLDEAVIEDVKQLSESMKVLYGRPLTKDEAMLAQLLLVTVHKSIHRLTMAIINTYLGTDRGRSESLAHTRDYMKRKREMSAGDPREHPIVPSPEQEDP